MKKYIKHKIGILFIKNEILWQLIIMEIKYYWLYFNEIINILNNKKYLYPKRLNIFGYNISKEIQCHNKK